MQDEHDEVWRWSVAFTEVLERLIGEPTSNAAARTVWPDHCNRLGWRRRDIEAARDLYLQARPERLRRLHDYWRIIAPDDTAEQVRYARETYHQFRFSASA
jgi:hypothetical protein